MTTTNAVPAIPDSAQRGRACCYWIDFYPTFRDEYAKAFAIDPDGEAWEQAVKDWKTSMTGWEAARMAVTREREKAEAAAAPALVNIGGRNFAPAGSELARRFGQAGTTTTSKETADG